MRSVNVSTLRKYGSQKNESFTVHVLALGGEEGALNFYAGVSYGDNEPIGLVSNHRGDDLRVWLSLQQLFQTLQGYIGRPVRMTQVLDTRAGDHASIKSFIKLFEIDQPLVLVGQFESVRVAFLNRIVDQVSEAARRRANP